VRPSQGHPYAQDSAAQQAATLALEAAKIVYTDRSDYTEATATALGVSEPSLTYVDAAVVWSESGTCFFIREQTTGIDYGPISGGTTADCAAGNEAAATFAADW